MPNYVKHIVTFEGDEKINDLIDFVKSEKSVFDFNRIIPMPEELKCDSSTMGDLGMKYLVAINKNDSELTDVDRKTISQVENSENKDEIIALGKTYLSNIVKYGSPTWYEWCIKNWGTKWNACEPELYLGDFGFLTAWSTCYPVIEKLSEKFPDVEINVKYADEDMGYNAGEYTFLNGKEIFSRRCEGGSDEALELYERVHDYWYRPEE